MASKNIDFPALVSFSKSWNYTCRSGSYSFSFLNNSLVQINSKLNLKPYDYLYTLEQSLLTCFFFISNMKATNTHK